MWRRWGFEDQSQSQYWLVLFSLKSQQRFGFGPGPKCPSKALQKSEIEREILKPVILHVEKLGRRENNVDTIFRKLQETIKRMRRHTWAIKSHTILISFTSSSYLVFISKNSAWNTNYIASSNANDIAAWCKCCPGISRIEDHRLMERTSVFGASEDTAPW